MEQLRRLGRAERGRSGGRDGRGEGSGDGESMRRGWRGSWWRSAATCLARRLRLLLLERQLDAALLLSLKQHNSDRSDANRHTPLGTPTTCPPVCLSGCVCADRLGCSLRLDFVRRQLDAGRHQNGTAKAGREERRGTTNGHTQEEGERAIRRTRDWRQVYRAPAGRSLRARTFCAFTMRTRERREARYEALVIFIRLLEIFGLRLDCDKSNLEEFRGRNS